MLYLFFFCPFAVSPHCDLKASSPSLFHAYSDPRAWTALVRAPREQLCWEQALDRRPSTYTRVQPVAPRIAPPPAARPPRPAGAPSGAERSPTAEGKEEACPPLSPGRRDAADVPRAAIGWRGGEGAWRSAPPLYKPAAEGRRVRASGRRGGACRRHARAVGAAGGRRAGQPGELRLRVAGQRLRLGGRPRSDFPAGPGAAARPRGRAAERPAAGAGAGRAGQRPAGLPPPLAPADAGPARRAAEERAAAPGLQRALRAARGPPRPLRGARQGLPRRGAHRRGPRRGAHLPADPGAAAGLPPLAQDPGAPRLGARLQPGLQSVPEAQHGLQGDEEEAVQLRAAAHRGVLMWRGPLAWRARWPSAAPTVTGEAQGCSWGPAASPTFRGPTRRVVAMPLGSAAGLLQGQALSC